MTSQCINVVQTYDHNTSWFNFSANHFMLMWKSDSSNTRVRHYVLIIILHLVWITIVRRYRRFNICVMLTSEKVSFKRLYILMHDLQCLDNVINERCGRIHADIDGVVCEHLNRQVLCWVSEICHQVFPRSSLVSIFHVLPESGFHCLYACATMPRHIKFRNDFNMTVISIL